MMDNKSKKHSFLAYINNPMSRESIMVLYDANNIKFERMELYSDFVQSLLRLVFDTYLGDDVTSSEQQINHFNWCWNENNSNFKKEGISFDNPKLYDYFLEFTLELFYLSTDKKEHEYTDKNLLNLWTNIFDYTKSKTNSDMDNLIEIYGIFEKSLKFA